MKRFLSLITTIVLVLNVFCATNPISFGFVAKAETAISAIPQPVDLTAREDFAIGVNVHSALYTAYPDVYLAEQIHAVARMGSKWIRLNGQLIKEGDWSYLDTAVGLCNKYGLKIIMVLDLDMTVSLEYITLMCETYARRYNGEEGRGYVDYFQVWNEVDIDLLQAKYGGSSPGGELETHYYTVPVDGAADLPEYLEYFEAAEKGIHSKDSNSKFMINFSARHCGMISYFLRNGLKIDMVGWDLYANRPYDREASALDLTSDYDLIQEKIYEPYGVPVILCETNINTHKLTEDDCKKYELGMEIYQIAIDNLYLAYNRPWIKGAIMYELLDEPVRGHGAPESCYGLIKTSSDGSGILDTANEKTIYLELQRFLGGNRDLPLIKQSDVDLKPYEKLVVDTADDSLIGKDDVQDDSTTNIEDIPSFDWNTGDDIADDTIIEPEIEEVIVENVINPVKELKQKETIYEIPWLMIILCSAGMLLLAGGAVTAFIVINKKKALKNSK